MAAGRDSIVFDFFVFQRQLKKQFAFINIKLHRHNAVELYLLRKRFILQKRDLGEEECAVGEHKKDAFFSRE